VHGPHGETITGPRSHEGGGHGTATFVSHGVLTVAGGKVTVKAMGRVTMKSVLGPPLEVGESVSELDPPPGRPVRTASGGVLGLVFGSDATAQMITVVRTGNTRSVRKAKGDKCMGKCMDSLPWEIAVRRNTGPIRRRWAP
jgi:hypothetical protein